MFPAPPGRRFPVSLPALPLTCILILLAALIVYATPLAAQTTGAVLTYPKHGAQNVDTRLPFQWSAVPAQSYRLQLGSLPPEPNAETGGITSILTADLFDSGDVTTITTEVPALPANHMLYARLWTQASGGGWTYSDSTFSAVAQPAHFTYPLDGAVDVDTRTPFTWTAVDGAQNYYLRIGTTLGGSNLLSSGTLANTVTSQTLRTSLPLGQPLFARVSTKLNDRWWSSDISFQVMWRPATLTYPTNGLMHADSRRAVTWNAAGGATGYALTIGTTPGSNDLVDTGQLPPATISYTLSQALPTGQPLYARMATLFSTVWLTTDITFQAAARPATFIYPQPNAVNVDTRLPITWAPVAGAQAYYLKIGTTPGAYDLLYTGSLSNITNSFNLKQPLPANQTLHARLSTLLDGIWWYEDISFTAVGRPATFTYPLSGNLKFDPRQPFAWTAAPGAQNYYLRVGTSLGAQDVVNTSSLASTVTTYTTSKALPAGQLLYGRISTKLNNIWWHSDITFQAIPRPAAFVYPTNNSVKVDSRLPFTWTAVGGAQAYYFKIGTAVGAQDIVNSGQLGAGVTSFTLPGELPAGQTLYARISTKLSDTWWYTDITFQAVPYPAVFTNPANGATHVDWRTPMTWNAIAGAQGYAVRIGTSLGAQDLLNSNTLAATATSYTPTGPLPVGQTLYARLSTRYANTWWNTDITFEAAPSPATFICPVKSQKVDILNTPFSWNAVPHAVAYALTIGSTQGADNLLNTGEITGTSYFVPPLTVGPILWARLGTKDAEGNWDYVDVSFLAQGVPLVFTTPMHGAVDVGLTPTLGWSAAPVVNGIMPTYLLTIGTAPGLGDLLRTDFISATSFEVTTPLPAGQVLYARVLGKLGDGSRRYGDSAFTTVGAPVSSVTLLYPLESDVQNAAGGGVDIDFSRPLAWQVPEMAVAHQVQLYNAVGAPDGNNQPDITGLTLAQDSGVIHVPRVFFSDLPAGPYTARLGVQRADGWHWRTFALNATHTGSDSAEQVAAGLWATNFVRAMADGGNYPYNWSLLPKYMAHWPQATCLDYRETLLVIAKEMRLTSQFAGALQPRRLNICLRSNSYDSHALAEMYNSADGRWVILDPTFAMAVTLTADGRYATKEEVQQATLAKQWGDITYTPLGSYGLSLAEGYHIDYPLLYLNVSIPTVGTGNLTMDYFAPVAAPVSQAGAYALYSPQSPFTVTVDGSARTFTTTLENMAKIFTATSVVIPIDAPPGVQIYKPRRYVFINGRF